MAASSHEARARLVVCEPLSAREAALQARIDDLELQLEDLRAALAPTWRSPRDWRLTRQEEETMRLLVARELVTAALFNAHALNVSRDERMDPVRHFSIIVHRLRRRVQPFGVTIQSWRARGYFLPPAQRAALAAGAVTLAPEGGS